jgi:hypothetical protein
MEDEAIIQQQPKKQLVIKPKRCEAPHGGNKRSFDTAHTAYTSVTSSPGLKGTVAWDVFIFHSNVSRIESKDLNLIYFFAELCMHLAYSESAPRFFSNLWELHRVNISIMGDGISEPQQCVGSGMFIPDPGSDFFPSRIPDPNCLHPGSRILIKEFKYFNPKKAKKWFLSSKKYVPGCSSRIPDPDADFLPSRIQGSKSHPIPDPGFGSATLAPREQNAIAIFRLSHRKISLCVRYSPYALNELNLVLTQ